MLKHTYTQADGKRLTFDTLQSFLVHVVRRADRPDRVPVLIDTHSGGMDMHELACIDMHGAAPLGAAPAALSVSVSVGVHHG